MLLCACNAGGLGDVMGALPKALARRGHRVMVVVPRYSNYEEGWETGVRARFRVSGSDTEVGASHKNPDAMCYHEKAAVKIAYGGLHRCLCSQWTPSSFQQQ